MPQIRWIELFIIVVIAILVIGPKDFPTVLRKLGSWASTVKKYFLDVQTNINEITNLDIDTNNNFKSKSDNKSESKRNENIDDKKK